MATAAFEDIAETFGFLDDWEDRYRHVIDLGRAMPPLDDSFKVPALKVDGCASQVWIHSRIQMTPEGQKLHLQGDSDALIVKGLIAVLFAVYAGKSLEEILATDAQAVFASLGLKDHLTPQRSNGLAAMVQRIRTDAEAALRA